VNPVPHDQALWDLGRATCDVIEGHSYRRMTEFRTLRKYIFRVFALHILSKMDNMLNERTVSSSNTILSLAMIRTVTMYKFFFDFEVQVASRARHTASHDCQFADPFGSSTYNTS